MSNETRDLLVRLTAFKDEMDGLFGSGLKEALEVYSGLRKASGYAEWVEQYRLSMLPDCESCVEKKMAVLEGFLRTYDPGVLRDLLGDVLVAYDLLSGGEQR